MTTLLEKNQIELYDLRVHPNFQRKGIATCMIRYLQNLRLPILIESQNNNLPAYYFYRSLGAKLIQINPDVYPDELFHEIQLIWRLD